MKKLFAIIALLALLPFTTSASLFEYYKSKGQNLPSISERAIVAAEYGIFGYTGSADQNKLLESRLKSSEDNLGASVVSRYRTRLSSSMTSSQSTVPVSSLVTFDGHTLTMADVDNLVFLVIEPGTSREEIVKCTSISSTSWATCTRGLAFYGKTETEVAANKKAHNAGSTVVMSNVHYVYEQLTDKDSNETLTGLKIFNQFPQYQNGTTAPTSSAQFAPKFYVDSVAQQAGVTSTEALTGIVQLGTQQEMASSTWDSNVPTVLQTQYSTSSPYTTGFWIPISENDGKLNHNWLDLTDNFNWIGENTFNASSTFNATSTFATTTFNVLPTIPLTPVATTDAASKGYTDTQDAAIIASTSKRIYTDTTTHTFTNSNAENTILTTTITGDSLSTANIVKFKIYWNALHSGASGQTLSLRLYYGATEVALAGNSGLDIPTNTMSGYIEGEIIAAGATNSQVGAIRIFGSENGFSISGIVNDAIYFMDNGTAAEDSTANKTLRVSMQLSHVNADFQTVYGYVELIR